MEKKYGNSMEKKVLIITGTPFRNDSNTGKTLIALFDRYKNSELAQLYFSPQTPNVCNCQTYYQINETQLIRSCFGLKKTKCGVIISKPDLSSQLVRYGNNLVRSGRSTPMMLARELLWALSHWKNTQFWSWIIEFDPNVIFTIMPSSIYRATVVRKISEKIGIPVVMFVTDDYYNDPKQSKELIRKAYYKNIQKVELSINVQSKEDPKSNITAVAP